MMRGGERREEQLCLVRMRSYELSGCSTSARTFVGLFWGVSPMASAAAPQRLGTINGTSLTWSPAELILKHSNRYPRNA